MIEQGRDDVQLIVVDPGSTDGTERVVDAYSEHVAIRVTKSDSGPPQGLNHGFAEATGDIYGFLNADDLLLPGALDVVHRSFERLPDAGAIVGDGYVLDERGLPDKKPHYRRFLAGGMGLESFRRGSLAFLQQSVFFRAERFHEVGGFNEDNRTCWDGELFLDMARAGTQFENVHQFLSVFRLHDSSITGTGRLNTAYARDRERLHEKYGLQEVGGMVVRLERLKGRAVREISARRADHP